MELTDLCLIVVLKLPIQVELTDWSGTDGLALGYN